MCRGNFAEVLILNSTFFPRSLSPFLFFMSFPCLNSLQYRVGQLYMIAKHSEEQSQTGEGVEVLKNEDCCDPVHGKGRFTEKRIYVSR